MGNLKSKIISKIIQPYNSNVFDTTLAVVDSYNDYYNRATITFQDPMGPGDIQLENVPVQIAGSGVIASAPKQGTHVWVTFANKTILHPKIVSIADERYQVKTREETKHTRQGSTLPDSISEADPNADLLDVSTLTPSINDWLDVSNLDYNKYEAFRYIDPIKMFDKVTENLNYYNAQEVGITHPQNSSTIKIRDNGIIDVLVATNQGFRIDPTTNTVNVIGTNIKNHSTDFNVFSSNSVNIVTKKFTVNGVDFTGGGGGLGYTFEDL